MNSKKFNLKDGSTIEFLNSGSYKILKREEYIEENIFDSSELQYWSAISEEWINHSGGIKYRLKPKPDYSKEIDVLQNKAKENGMKVTINFEKL